MEPYQLLTLTVALSAYLAGIRISALNRMADTHTTPERKKSLTAFLFWVAPADMCFVVAVLTMLVYLFPEQLMLGTGHSEVALGTAKFLFCLGVIILAVHHAIAWFKSARKYLSR